MGCTLCTMVGDPAAGVPSAALPERQTDLERVEAQARVQSGVTSVTEGVVELMLRGRRHGIFNDDTEDGTTVLDAGDVTVDVPSTLSMEDNLLIVESLRANELFSCLEPPHLEVLAKRMTVLRVHGGDIVYTQGDMGDTLYIIKSGHFDVTTNDDRMRALVVGNSFGELGLLYKCIRTETVGLSDEGGNYGDLFCLKVVCTDIGALDDIELHDGEYFGERALMKDEPRAATVYAKTGVHVMALDREVFTSDDDDDEMIVMMIGRHNLMMRSVQSIPLLKDLSELQKQQLIDQTPLIPYTANQTILTEGAFGNDFYIVVSGQVNVTQAIDDRVVHLNTLSSGDYFGEQRTKVLGIGSFGLVYIAKHVPTGRFVAVKEMYKARLETSKQMGHVLAEKDLLSSFHHPFILKYLVALQEERKVYIVTESLLGGELFQRIVNPAGVPTPLPMDSARFYAGCVVKALKYLHTRNVAYRDLKPENILLDSHGYAKIVDFGFAKKLTQKTYTLCGTPEYLAPEIVMGIGHGFMVDNWALGILIYEMVVGDSPFADIKDDHMTICRSILRGKVEFRKDADPEWRRLVEGLLTREPTKRMSCLAGAVESHPWFNGFAWDDLLAQKMPAPWTPNVVAGDDVRWFSPVDTDELAELKEWDFVSPEKDWSEF
ncbi:hypothetical protein DYB25_001381 [Aphanomyces astaci]|uniref:cGMP-dependent protein kinase n=2 Tax=Aphanomyces astaci TaxID=112090 RepID=A0A397E3B4_APHAT|nr:hypothetical protein DYB25_001381 [Aphanomyces astaci]RHY72909.1 hypothetical protein DYB30_001008 [Aphanomyces astaci]